MESVLVTCATRPFGMRVANLLEKAFKVVKASSDDIPSVLQNQFVKIPKGNDVVFGHQLLKSCLDNNCSYVLPLHIDEVKALAESIILFEEYGIKVLSPSLEEIEALDFAENLPKEVELDLIYANQSLLNNSKYEYLPNGLGLVSDSGEGFILAVSK